MSAKKLPFLVKHVGWWQLAGLEFSVAFSENGVLKADIYPDISLMILIINTYSIIGTIISIPRVFLDPYGTILG